MNRERALRLKYFALSFAAAFLVISLLFLFLVTTVHPRTPKSLEPDAAPVEASYVAEAADSLTVLFFGTGETDGVAGTYILARLDALAGQVSLAVLPGQTLVEHAGKAETLAEAYRYGGAQYTRQALANYLGITIDRYVRVSADRFVQAAGVIGSVEFDLDEELTLEDGAMTLTLGAGRQLLDGRKAAAIIRHGGYEGGEPARCAMTARLACAIIDQRIDVAQSTLSDKVFSAVVNLVETDISYSDYERRKALAVQMAEGERPIARAVELGGELSEDGERYRLYDTTLAQIARWFV